MLAPGSHNIRAQYTGDSHCNAASSHADLIVGCTISFVTLVSSKNPSQVGDVVTFTATESGGCGGSISFVIDGVTVASGLPIPVASFTTSSLTAGLHTVTASYIGLPPAIASLTQTVGGGPAVPAVCLFGDGRINCRAEDAAQTAAIYCEADGGVTLWAVLNGPNSGSFEFTATGAEVNAVPQYPTRNTLIKRLNGFSLWRLRGGYLQVNAPRDYVYIWQGC